MLQDPKFKNRILEIMDIEVIGNYKDRKGDVESFEDIDKEDTQENQAV